MNRLNAYREVNIKTASQGKLILMLYDGAIRELDNGISLMESSKHSLDKINNAITKAQDFITELIVSLDFDKGQDIARNLYNLYMFFNQQLVQANVDKDVEPLRSVRSLMADLRSAWEEIIAKGASGGQAQGGVNIAG